MKLKKTKLLVLVYHELLYPSHQIWNNSPANAKVKEDKAYLLAKEGLA